MRYAFLTILIITITWLLWASLSVGGLYQLQQKQSAQAQLSNSESYLISKLYSLESSGLWDNHHVKNCWVYMPDWVKAEECVKKRIECEVQAPLLSEKFLGKSYPDIFSVEYKLCEKKNRPFLGLKELLRASRSEFRANVALGRMWLKGSSEDRSSAEQAEWERKNTHRVNRVISWVEKGR